jgi:hypothetical protein
VTNLWPNRTDRRRVPSRGLRLAGPFRAEGLARVVRQKTAAHERPDHLHDMAPLERDDPLYRVRPSRPGPPPIRNGPPREAVGLRAVVRNRR